MKKFLLSLLPALLVVPTPSVAGSLLLVTNTNVPPWLATPTSANLATALTNETGTGNAVFSASPTLSGTVTAGNISGGDFTADRGNSTGYYFFTGASRSLGYDGTNYVFAGVPVTAPGVISTTYVKSGVYTVATLPSASTSGAGARAAVTDATAPVLTSTVVGGGAVFTPVISDGTNWKVG